MAGGLGHIKKAAPKAERRQLTVMFCDLVGSTALSEQFDPEDMREVLTTYRQACAKAITRFDGFLARYIGDGILVYFGYPNAHEYEAEHAVRAALEIVENLSRLHTPPLKVRVGIATGTVVVGDIIGEGTEEHHAVVGQTPNLAARLISLANPGEVMIADSTRNLLHDLFEFHDMGRKTLKGFKDPVRAWQIVGESAIRSRSHAIHQRTHLTPLITREEEIKRLTHCWEEAKAGRGQVALISGEAGIGKSRLARHFEEQVKKERKAPSIKSLYCSENYKNSILHPIIEYILIESKIDGKDSDKKKVKKIETYLDSIDKNNDENNFAILDLLSIKHDDDYNIIPLNPDVRKTKIFRALEQIICDQSNNSPKIIIMEDLHWSDPTTLEFLSLIIMNSVQNIGILIIITFRTEFQPTWPDEHFITNFKIKRLSPADSEKLLHAIAKNTQLPDKIIDEIIKRSDRIPLFLEEVYKATRENIALNAGEKKLATAQSFTVRDVPSSLAGSLMERLDRLGSVKSVAQVAAAIGHQFSRTVLREALNARGFELGNALDQLVQSEIIYPRDRATEDVYVFKHALLQDAAYSSLLRNERMTLHACIAQVLEEKHAETVNREPELLAHHYSRGGLAEQAIDFWQKAGERARERSANSEAIGHISSGLDLLKTLPESPTNSQREIDLRTNLALALTALHGGGDAKVKENYAKARQLSQLDRHSPKHFTIMIGSWLNSFIGGDLFDALSLSNELLELATYKDNVAYLIEAKRVRGMTLFYVGDFAGARDAVESALQIHDPEFHRLHAVRYGLDPLVCCQAYLAYTNLFLGYSEEALRKSDDAVAAARSLAHPYSIAFSLAFAAFVRQNLDMTNATREFANMAIAVSEENEFQFFAKQQLVVRNWAEARMGNDKTSLLEMRNALESFMKSGSLIGATRILSLMAEVYTENKMSDEGMLMLEKAKHIADKSGEKFYLAEIHRLDGALRLIDGRELALAESCACFHRSLNVAQAQNADHWLVRTAKSIAVVGQQFCPQDGAVSQLVNLCETIGEKNTSEQVVKASRDLLQKLSNYSSDPG